MTANPSSLQARLDAMVREADKNVYGHAEDCRLRECGDSCSCGLVEQNIALDLLRQLTESEAKVAALEAKLCRMVDLAGEADDTMREGNFCGAQAILQIILIEARKKGAEHGE